MESASFQQPLVPWGSETRLHTGPYMDGSGAGPSAPPSGPRPRPLGVDALLLWEETYLVETGGHKVLLDACPHQPAIPAVLMGPRALEEEKDGTRLSLGGLPGGGYPPESPPEGRRGELGTALHPEGLLGHQAWAQSPSL